MSVEIRVYPNQMDDEEVELIERKAGITLHGYLVETVPDYHVRPMPPFTALLNKNPFPADQWEYVSLHDGDLVECIVEPKEPLTITLAVIAVVSVGYAIYMANQPLPDTYNNTTPSGSSIYDANAQGNRPRLMGTVPVLFGRHKMYPDYVNPPRIIYRDNQQVLYMMLCVAVGEIEFTGDDIFIGDTQLSYFGDSINFKKFGPGEDVTSHEAYKTEYRSVEVGSTTSSQGLELAGAVYEFDWVVANGSFYYEWWISSSNTKELFMIKANYNDGTISNAQDYNWHYDYYQKRSDSLIGQTFEFYTDAGGIIGLYRVTSTRTYNNGITTEYYATFDKVDANGNVDTSWTGFISPIETSQFAQAKYRIVNPVEQDRYIGPYVAVPFGGSTENIVLDFRFNQGLTIIDNGGDPTSRTVDLEIQWRDGNEGAWNTVNKSYTAQTVDQLAYTLEISVPAGTVPDVRIRRLTADENDITYKDAVDWVGLRTALESATSYPGVTTLALEITGSNELAGSAENKVSVIPTAINTKFNSAGEMTDYGTNQSISSAIYLVANELGYELDMDELWRLHQTFDARGDEFNGVYDNVSTAWKVMQQILAVGFSEPTLDFGKIIPIRDEPRTTLNYQYQPENILPNSWKMEGAFYKDSEADGIEVEYFSEDTWKPETVLCLLPGDEGLNTEKLRAFGITDKTLAYRWGMRQRSLQRFRNIRHTFSTEMDALNSRYLSYDGLGINMPGLAQTGRVEAVGSTKKIIYLSEDLEWGSGVHHIGIRRPNGTLSGPYECTQYKSLNAVKLKTALDFDPVFNGTHEPPYFTFGEADSWVVPVLVTKIKPSGTNKVKVESFEYSDDVYLYDNAEPPE